MTWTSPPWWSWGWCLLVSMAMNSLALLLIWRVSGGGSGRSFFVWTLLFREWTPIVPTATEVAE